MILLNFMLQQTFFRSINRNIKNETIKEKLKKAVCEGVKLLVDDDITFDEQLGYDGDYVISFCLDKDSILMWSEYSNFCGYSIEFDFEALIHSFSNKDNIIHGKVVYNHEEQTSLMEQIIEKEIFKFPYLYEYLNSWDEFNKITDDQIREIASQLEILVYYYNMFFKKECFSGENEYRFVFMCNHNGVSSHSLKKEPQYFRVKDNVLIPFVKKKLSSLDSVNSILIGPKNNSDIAEKGVKHFLRYHKINAKVEKSEMPLRY